MVSPPCVPPTVFSRRIPHQSVDCALGLTLSVYYTSCPLSGPRTGPHFFYAFIFVVVF